MSDLRSEEELLNLLYQSEEYDDALDMLHPEYEISSDFQVFSDSQIFSGSIKIDSNFKLAIVVGHTKQRSGALGVSPISTSEYFWNTKLAKLIKSVAINNNINCEIFYRDGIGISGAYKKVNDWSAQSCIELHFNSFNGKVEGTETLYGLLKESEEWATVVQEEMVNLYSREGNRDRGIKKRVIGERGGRNVNQLNNIPSCLIEPYFGDVPTEAQLADNYLLNLADALVAAHLKMFS